MKIKKHIAAFMAAVTLLAVTPAALAAGKSCSITAQSGSAAAGESVSVTVSISDNPGYTNYGIALDYDREKLELLSIESTAQAPALSSCSTQWTPAENSGLDTAKSYAYVTAAHAEQQSENGAIFTASFKVLEGAEGEAQVTPKVIYVRDNTALFSVFEEIGAQVTSAFISIESSGTEDFLLGDVNSDGAITGMDAAKVYAYYNGKIELTDAELKAADANGDTVVSGVDAAAIYALFNGKIEKLPAA